MGGDYRETGSGIRTRRMRSPGRTPPNGLQPALPGPSFTGPVHLPPTQNPHPSSHDPQRGFSRMSLNHDGPPHDPHITRPHLRPVNDPEPPFDPDHDQPTDRRTPPQDNAAEQAALGAMLLDPNQVDAVTEIIAGSDYYRPTHEYLHDTLVRLHRDGRPIDDPTLLITELTRITSPTRGTLLEYVGGAPYLHTLMAACTAPTRAAEYAAVVRDYARLRVAETLGTRLTALARTGTPSSLDVVLGEAVQALDDAAMRFGTLTSSTLTGLKDLTWLHNGQPPPMDPPVWSTRTDGTALFYAAKVNGIFGDPECGKTWLAQTAIVEALRAGQSAAMIDVDHNGQNHTTARLLLLGAHIRDLADPARFRYYEPEDADELRAAVDDVVRHQPAVLVIDSLGEVFPMLGVPTNDGDEMTTAMRQVCTRPATAGACVITIDHLPKSHDARATGFAIGTIAKKRMIRGSYIRAEARQQPTPGGIGRITLRIEKDTTGELRKSSGGGYAGTLTLDSTHEHTVAWTIGRDEAPKNDDGTFRPTGYMEKVATFVVNNDGCTQNDIETSIPGTSKHIRDALRILVTEGHITRTPGPRRSWHHSLSIPYREAEDDHAQPTL